MNSQNCFNLVINSDIILVAINVRVAVLASHTILYNTIWSCPLSKILYLLIVSQCLPTIVKIKTGFVFMTPNWWSSQCWYFWGFGSRMPDPNQTHRLYRFCQHYCPLFNITRPHIRIGYIIYIIYLVILYLELSVPLQFPDAANIL